ncbi:class IV adenylate cyclase [Streptomyces sp. NPDC003691]
MIEAELKARVSRPEVVRRSLDARAAGRDEVYRDTYYDTPDQALGSADQELRVRTVHGPDGLRTVLTFKGARVDDESGSKPEHESRVDDPKAVHALLLGLGYVPVIEFEKQCRNYTFDALGRRMLATLVRVPELEGTFLEVETLAEDTDVTAALADVRSVLHSLGIGEAELTRELYTEAVRASR